MDALPLAATIAADAVRAQFAAPVPATPRPEARPSRWRLALATTLERAARAVAPAGHVPAH
jgi:hypothetical protein